MQYQVKFFLRLKYSVIMVSGPGAEFLVKKPLVPTEYEAVWPPFYTWSQATKSLYIAGAEPWPQCTVSQLY